MKISSVEKRISPTGDLTLGIDRLVFRRLPVDVEEALMLLNKMKCGWGRNDVF